MSEQSFGSDRIGFDVSATMVESGRETGQIKIEKWDIDQINWVRAKDYNGNRIINPKEEPVKRHFLRYKCLPFETVQDEDCNLIVATGWAQCLHAGAWLTGTTAVVFGVAVGRVGLGIGSTAATYSDVNLTTQTGWTGNQWILCGVAPTYTAATGGTPATMVFTATFTTASFNASLITEFAVDAGTASGTTVTAPIMNHGVNGGGYGTKTNSQTWNTTVTMTFT